MYFGVANVKKNCPLPIKGEKLYVWGVLESQIKQIMRIHGLFGTSGLAHLPLTQTIKAPIKYSKYWILVENPYI